MICETFRIGHATAYRVPAVHAALYEKADDRVVAELSSAGAVIAPVSHRGSLRQRNQPTRESSARGSALLAAGCAHLSGALNSIGSKTARATGRD